MAAAIGLTVLGAALFGAADAIDRYLGDLRFEVLQRAPGSNIVLVDIDGRSLAEVGVWPWPRSLYGDLVARAASAGAARIAFDIDFSASSTPGEDAAFAAALAASEAETFLAAFVQPGGANSDRLLLSTPIETLLRHSWPAIVNVPVDPDGTVRRFPYGIRAGAEELETLPSVLAGGPVRTGEFGIDFSISAAGLPRVSFIDVVNGAAGADMLEGKTLLVGATAIELHDNFRVPVHGNVSGSTLIALATETLLQGRDLAFRSLPPALLVMAGIAAFLGFLYTRSWLVLLPVAGAALATEALAYHLQLSGNVVLATAGMHLLLAGFAVWALTREFDLRRLLLWIARTEVSNSRSLLERVVEDGFDGVVIVDHNDHVSRTNKLASELLGLRRAARLEDLPAAIVDKIREKRQALAAGAVIQREQYTLDLAVKEGERRVLEYTVAPFWMQAIADEDIADDAVCVCLSIRDATRRQVAQEKLYFMALHDGLTGLYNRAALEQRLGEPARFGGAGAGLALLAFDLDRFKAINDALGHAVGDKVLVEAARRAKKAFGTHARIARVGGDAFFALLAVGDPEEARARAAAFLAAMEEPFAVLHHRIAIGARIGISWWRGETKEPATAMREADIALHRAKGSGTRIILFDPAMEKEHVARLELERDLASALDNNEMHLAYQPQIALRSGEIIGAEALLRWRHPDKGDVPPALFIPVAEESGLIHRLGAWVLARACCDAACWPMPLKVAVNVSSLQFETGDVMAAVKEALHISGLDPGRLELEITESAFVKESERLRDIFDQVTALGVSFALDDFGTGYSSLSYLHRFPVSKIKIDQSFVCGIPTDAHAMAILRSIRALAEGLGIRTIAEGVETERQAETLRVLGFHEGQGYLYARPLRDEALVRFMDGSRAMGAVAG